MHDCGFYKVLDRIGYPQKLLKVIHAFHNGMLAKVNFDSDLPKHLAWSAESNKGMS